MTDKLIQPVEEAASNKVILAEKLQASDEKNVKLSEQLKKLENELAQEIAVRHTNVNALETRALQLDAERGKALSALRQANRSAQLAERRLWSTMSAISDGFMLFDKDEKLALINSSASNLLGTTDRQNIVGSTMVEILQNAFAEDRFLTLENITKDDFSEFIEEFVKGDNEIILKCSADRWMRLLWRNSKARDSIALFVDVSDLMRREVDLKRARQNADIANRAKTSFLANISHEIRTPMNGIIGMTELLSETPLNEEQTGFITTIRNSGEALISIINDVLDYSKVEAGKLDLYVAPFSFSQVVEEICQLMRHNAESKNLELRLDFSKNLPELLIGDAGRIRQVLINIIGNAIKFTKEGHVSIQVSSEEKDNFSHMKIIVKDTGLGIAENQLANIFGQFIQADATFNRRHEGTGLGLSISKRIIDLMGGKIWVTSKTGEGSEFNIELRLPVAELNIKKRDKLKSQMVWVVDDVASNRQIFEKLIQMLGYQVRVFESGAAVLNAMADGSCMDLLLTDYQMPNMLGSDLAKKVKTIDQNIPIIITFSSNSFSEVSVKNLFFATLEKPVFRANLEKVVIAALNLEVEAGVIDIEEEQIAPFHMDKPLKILIAEDNKTNQLVVKKMMKTIQHEFRLVENGRDAVLAYKEYNPDIILMDISMPEMDGTEATSLIRTFESANDREETPIIALTAHAMRGDAERFKAVGMNVVLSKPIKKTELIGSITEMANGIGIAVKTV